MEGSTPWAEKARFLGTTRDVGIPRWYRVAAVAVAPARRRAPGHTARAETRRILDLAIQPLCYPSTSAEAEKERWAIPVVSRSL
jgi:hypothetical protein